LDDFVKSAREMTRFNKKSYDSYEDDNLNTMGGVNPHESFG